MSTVSATKRRRFSVFPTPPRRRYSNASSTVPEGAVERDVSSASGSASPPKRSRGVPASAQRRRRSSRPSGQALRPPSRRTMTARAPGSSPSRNAGVSSSETGLAQRTAGKPSGSLSAALAADRISVSAVVRNNKVSGIRHRLSGKVLGYRFWVPFVSEVRLAGRTASDDEAPPYDLDSVFAERVSPTIS